MPRNDLGPGRCVLVSRCVLVTRCSAGWSNSVGFATGRRKHPGTHEDAAEGFLFDTWQIQTMNTCAGDGVIIAGIGMAHHPCRRIVPKHALDTSRSGWRAIGDDDHAGMLAEPDPDAAAVMERHPGGAARAVQQRIEQRPVGNRVAPMSARRGDALLDSWIFAARHGLVDCVWLQGRRTRLARASPPARQHLKPLPPNAGSFDGIRMLIFRVHPGRALRCAWLSALSCVIRMVLVDFRPSVQRRSAQQPAARLAPDDADAAKQSRRMQSIRTRLGFKVSTGECRARRRRRSNLCGTRQCVPAAPALLRKSLPGGFDVVPIRTG